MDLTNYVQKVSLEDFGKPFRHRVVWNRRLRTSGGRFFPHDGHLDFSPRILEEYGEAVFRQVVRHELTHYHLYFENKGYKHGDADFKRLLKEVDGLRYAPPPKNRRLHTYSCRSCGLSFQRQRRIHLDRYRCGSCGGRLQDQANQTQG
ncbi:SprT family protein [Streptococcus sp. 10F2]